MSVSKNSDLLFFCKYKCPCQLSIFTWFLNPIKHTTNPSKQCIILFYLGLTFLSNLNQCLAHFLITFTKSYSYSFYDRSSLLTNWVFPISVTKFSTSFSYIITFFLLLSFDSLHRLLFCTVFLQFSNLFLIHPWFWKLLTFPGGLSKQKHWCLLSLISNLISKNNTFLRSVFMLELSDFPDNSPSSPRDLTCMQF